MDNIKWHDSDLIKNIKNKINGKYPIKKYLLQLLLKNILNVVITLMNLYQKAVLN